ncbi:MAG: class I SAM-dependent methyltransferase, partial [bacterium]
SPILKTRSNSFNFLPVKTISPQELLCRGGKGLKSLNVARSLLAEMDARILLCTTDTGDFTDEEIMTIKYDEGQVYFEPAGKDADIDFKHDLVKLTLWEDCDACAHRDECPGVFQKQAGDIFAESEGIVEAHIHGLSGSVLDVGCGTIRYRDTFLELLREGRIQYTGIEPNPEEDITQTGMKILRSGIEEFEGDTGTGAFDHILVLRSFNHYTDLRRALRNIHRLLAEGGSLLVVDNSVFAVVRPEGYTPVAATADSMQHYHTYGAEQAAKALKSAGFTVREIHPVQPRGCNQWIVLCSK